MDAEPARVTIGVDPYPAFDAPGTPPLSYAFPYDEIQNGVYKRLITRTGPLARNVLGYDPEIFLYQTDLAKAKELILAGGFAEGDSFEYAFASGEAVERSVAELFQANIAEMGFNLDISELDSATYNDLIYGDAPAEKKRGGLDRPVSSCRF